ncbi:MAG: hypothetical protein GQ544_10100 [Candidatus Aminicenantes bacterium]|nr:hypothetical protein [Candidatus Aminicenantes bacterium]
MAITKTLGNNWYHVLGVAFLICALTLVGGVSCQQAEEDIVEEAGPTLEEGKVAFEGTVKVALGKYMFVPEAQGFDIVVDGTVDGGGLTSLIGKEVKGEGEFPPETPWIMFATKLEVKDDSGNFRNVFTGTVGSAAGLDLLTLQARDEYVMPEELAYNKNDVWEGIEKLKVKGKLQQEGETTRILVLDDEDNQIGRVVVDSVSDAAQYYLQKLRLFEEFGFYLSVKETVPWNVRRRTRDMFHADLIFVGLY